MNAPLPGPVAYLTGEYPRATDTFIQREVAALRGAGITVLTASIRRTGPEHMVGPEQRAEQAGTFHVLEATAHPRLVLAKLAALARPGRFLRALALAWRTAPRGLRGRVWNLIYFAEALTLARWMRAQGVVHLHNHIAKASCTVAMLASELTGIPYSFTLHGPDDLAEPGHWRLDEKIARAAFVACISDFARAQAMLHAARVHWPRLHVVHCGVDPARYGRPRVPGRGRLLFVGRLAGVKGVPVLFQALSAVRALRPEVTLTLIGDGPERALLEEEGRALGLGDALRFTGYRDADFVAGALAEADVLVLPSFAEGVPVVLMEAMAARLPVVATRVGGVTELVEDGVSGHLVAPGNAALLARAILAALDAPSAMGAAARAQVEAAFDSRTEARRLATLLATAARGGVCPDIRPGALP
ncbi:MAG: glycosyltransferase family 4 protein [Rubellimicrobium sp.]|nr:glycosyltransferase family 4 protein [Rubellimicrobium sp.]